MGEELERRMSTKDSMKIRRKEKMRKGGKSGEK